MKAKLMNVTFSLKMGLVVATAIFLQHNATAVPTTVNLGSTRDFAVLAGSGITVAGAVNSSTINGDIGTFPTTSISGLENVTLNGVNHAGDAVTQNAKDDLVIAYDDAAGRTPVTTVVGDILGGLSLTSGVYGGGALDLTGTLTLNAEGNPDAVWIFQAESTLITATDSKVTLINGAEDYDVACHVFWQVGSSATLGTRTDFKGHILALTSIGLDPYATVEGQVLARNGAVTLSGYNTITKVVCADTGGNGGESVPDGGSTLLLLGSGLATLLGFGRRFRSLV
jgi:hypothetical protein